MVYQNLPSAYANQPAKKPELSALIQALSGQTNSLNLDQRFNPSFAANPVADSVESQNGPGIGDFIQNLLKSGREQIAGPQSSMLGGHQGIEPQTTMDALPTPSWDDQLLEQLNALAMQSGTPLDVDAMLQDATGGINKAYGAQVGSIKHQNQGAKADTREGSAQIRKMYAALARDMRKSGKREAKQGQHLAQQLQGIGQAGAQGITQNAGQLLDKNAAAASALGAPGIATELNSAVNAQTGHLAGNAINSGTRQATNQRGLSGVAQRYFNQAGASSQMEGTNRAADLFGDLQNYLQGNRDKIGEIQGQKAQALAAAKNEILANASQAQGDQSSDLFDKLMNMAKFKAGLEDTRADNQFNVDSLAGKQNQGSDFSQFFPEGMANNMNLGALANQSGMGGVNDLYKQIMGSPEAMNGYIEGDHNASMQLSNNYPALMQLIQQYASKADPQTQQLLMAMLGNSRFASNQPSN